MTEPTEQRAKHNANILDRMRGVEAKAMTEADRSDPGNPNATELTEQRIEERTREILTKAKGRSGAAMASRQAKLLAESQLRHEEALSAAYTRGLRDAREPTEAMLDAARDWAIKKYGIGIGNDAAIGCWQVMLDARLSALRDGGT